MNKDLNNIRPFKTIKKDMLIKGWTLEYSPMYSINDSLLCSSYLQVLYQITSIKNALSFFTGEQAVLLNEHSEFI